MATNEQNKTRTLLPRHAHLTPPRPRYAYRISLSFNGGFPRLLTSLLPLLSLPTLLSFMVIHSFFNFSFLAFYFILLPYYLGSFFHSSSLVFLFLPYFFSFPSLLFILFSFLSFSPLFLLFYLIPHSFLSSCISFFIVIFIFALALIQRK